MRILTWNINGILTLPNYHPWLQSKGNWDKLLDQIGADVICVQETKITRDKVNRNMALLQNYDSFFSSYSRKPPKGYSGTAIFTKKSVCIPVKAEEGLTGIIQADNAKTIPKSHNVGSYPPPSVLSSLDIDTSELRDLDIEGRTAIVDLGLFVLINLYCPNQTNDDRLIFKMAFNAMVEARVDALIQAGRQVMVVGDMNICSQEIDHCEPSKHEGDFGDTPPRRWFNRWISHQNLGGTMVDVCRVLHPKRKFMYTHWETRINARDSNYGTRIDYILVTPGLMPWVKACDIQPDVKGSDHCPVYIDLHDSITDEDGKQVNLWELVNPPGRLRDGPTPDPPLFAARYYPEHAQSLLSTFFTRKGGIPAHPTGVKMQPVPAESPEEELSVDAALARLHSSKVPTLQSTSTQSTNAQGSPSFPTASSSRLQSESPMPSSSTAGPSQKIASSRLLVDSEDDGVQHIASSSKPQSKKPELNLVRPSKGNPQDATIAKSEKAKGKQKADGKDKARSAKSPEQKTVKDFFAPPKAKPKPSDVLAAKSKKKRKAFEEIDDKAGQIETASKPPKKPKITNASISTQAAEDSDTESAERAAEANAASAVGAWSDLFAKKKEAPLCTMHGELDSVQRVGPEIRKLTNTIDIATDGKRKSLVSTKAANFGCALDRLEKVTATVPNSQNSVAIILNGRQMSTGHIWFRRARDGKGLNGFVVHTDQFFPVDGEFAAEIRAECRQEPLKN